MSSAWNNLSVSSHGNGPQSIGDELPACGSCRKRKLRCSRENPTCSHCERLGVSCVYEPKQKPGLKAGAVETLTRRVAFLESILLDDLGNVRSQFDTVNVSPGNPGQNSPLSTRNPSAIPELRSVAALSREDTDIHGSDQGQNTEPERLQLLSRKRKLDQTAFASSLVDMEYVDIAGYLPSQPLLVKLVDYFCVSFHHWIPYLHKQRLRDQVRNSVTHDAPYNLILHALVAATLRHLDRDVTFLDEDQVQHQTRISRFIVETFALKDVSLESLRALIIIVFDYLNYGMTRKAWPLIGSLTRTVDYLQLTIEPSASQTGALMNPLKLVPPTENWTQLEERRRLFWVIFQLDRFCSVSTGWNTSLTSEDVHRRLPADGGYFTREEPVTTPYFGIWNKSSARIGKSLAYVPPQYNEEDPVLADTVPGTSPGSTNGPTDSSKLGAFAYCLEATESLSQVTTFFLQQRINWQDKEHAVNWLTRFKELDLRLVHWKLFLPPRWKDSNISPDTEVVDMDPNLTLAHITHNTSMILLHHPIAYPPKGWKNYVALPKECSAQTCELAAVETSNIVDKFLTHRVVFVNAQFTFCTFVAAKALLFVSQASKIALRPEFQVLIRSLWEMSARWTHSSDDGDTTDQAGLYACHLERLLNQCKQDARFGFNLYDHTCLDLDRTTSDVGFPVTPTYPATPSRPVGPSTSSRRQSANKDPSTQHQGISVDNRRRSSNSASTTPSLANIMYVSNTSSVDYHRQHDGPQPSPNGVTSAFSIPRPPLGFIGEAQQMYPVAESPATGPLSVNGQHTVQDQSLLNLSDTFMDSHFLGLDRVITFEDANFVIPGDAFRWQ